MEPSVWEAVVSFVLSFGVVACSEVADCTCVSEPETKSGFKAPVLVSLEV